MEPIEKDNLARYDVIAKRVALYGGAVGIAGAAGATLIPFLSLWVPAGLLTLTVTLHAVAIKRRDWLQHPMIPYALACLFVTSILGFAITSTRVPTEQINALITTLTSSETPKPDSKTSMALFMYSVTAVFCSTLIADVFKLWIRPPNGQQDAE